MEEIRLLVYLKRKKIKNKTLTNIFVRVFMFVDKALVLSNHFVELYGFIQQWENMLEGTVSVLEKVQR